MSRTISKMHLPAAPGIMLCILLILLWPSAVISSGSSAVKSDGRLKTVAIHKASSLAPNKTVPETTVRFRVETAIGFDQQRKGLSGREKLPEDQGMLFILDNRADRFFWMKGMKFPLDILFFDDKGLLFEIFESLMPCTDCPLIKPSAPAAYALELNAGMTKKYSIRIGDRIVIEND